MTSQSILVLTAPLNRKFSLKLHSLLKVANHFVFVEKDVDFMRNYATFVVDEARYLFLLTHLKKIMIIRSADVKNLQNLLNALKIQMHLLSYCSDDGLDLV